MTKSTRHAPGRKVKPKKAAKKPKRSPKSAVRPTNPAVVMDEEFRRHPTTGTLDLRLAVTKVLRPHRLVIDDIDIVMPDGSTRLCEFYNISTAQEGRFAGNEFEGGLKVGSAFIIRDVRRRPAAWKNSVLRYINSCCVTKEEPKPEAATSTLEKRLARLENDVEALRGRMEAQREMLRALKVQLRTGTAVSEDDSRINFTFPWKVALMAGVIDVVREHDGTLSNVRLVAAKLGAATVFVPKDQREACLRRLSRACKAVEIR